MPHQLPDNHPSGIERPGGDGVTEGIELAKTTSESALETSISVLSPLEPARQETAWREMAASIVERVLVLHLFTVLLSRALVQFHLIWHFGRWP